jgi:hypothetical protein
MTFETKRPQKDREGRQGQCYPPLLNLSCKLGNVPKQFEEGFVSARCFSGLVREMRTVCPYPPSTFVKRIFAASNDHGFHGPSQIIGRVQDRFPGEISNGGHELVSPKHPPMSDIS